MTFSRKMRNFKNYSFYIIAALFCSCLLLQVQGVSAQASAGRVPQPKELLGQMRQALDALGAAEFGFEFRLMIQRPLIRQRIRLQSCAGRIRATIPSAVPYAG